MKLDAAIEIMESLYDETTAFGSRFKDPLKYIQNRKETEKWVRRQFMEKGRKPTDEFPIYFTLGDSRWIERNKPERAEEQKITIPLSSLNENDVSFTYPDSMVSLWFSKDPPIGLIDIDLFGKVFTKDEIIGIVEKEGYPEDDWDISIPSDIAPYIEAQVWNSNKLALFLEDRNR